MGLRLWSLLAHLYPAMSGDRWMKSEVGRADRKLGVEHKPCWMTPCPHCLIKIAWAGRPWMPLHLLSIGITTHTPSRERGWAFSCVTAGFSGAFKSVPSSDWKHIFSAFSDLWNTSTLPFDLESSEMWLPCKLEEKGSKKKLRRGPWAGFLQTLNNLYRVVLFYLNS